MAKGNKKVPPAARGGGSDFDNLKSPLAALGVEEKIIKEMVDFSSKI